MSIEENPLQLAYSCSICGRTASELYNNVDQNEGMHDGLGPNERSFLMLWLTDCGHLICRHELPNKLLDFFRDDEGPRLASCPKCTRDGLPEKQINLYWIRDFKEGGFDTRLPTSYFVIPDFKKHKFRPEDRTSLTLQYHGLCNAGTVLTRRIENSSRELKQSANDMQRLREENLRLKRRLTTHEQRSRLPAKSDSRISLPRSRPSTTALESTRPSKKPKYESSSYFQESQTPSSQAQATFLHPMKPRTAQSTLDKLSSCAPQSAPRSDSPDQHSTSFPSATPVSATRILRRGPELSSRDLMPPPPLPYSSPPPRRQPFRYPQVDRTLKRPLSSSQSPQALFVPLDRSTLSPSISFHQPPAVMTPHFTQQRQRLGPVPLTHISRQGVTAQPEYDMREYASQWEAASSEIDVPRGLRHRIDTSPTSSPSDDPRAHMHLSDSEQSMAATAAPDEGVDDRIVGYLEPFNRAPSTSNERKRLFRSLS